MEDIERSKLSLWRQALESGEQDVRTHEGLPPPYDEGTVVFYQASY
jgi:hypothetical protein